MPLIATPKQVARGWLYPLLLAAQTTGALILCWKGLPLYRMLLDDPTSYETRERIWVWTATAIGLIQIGYWWRYRVSPALPRLHNLLLGHVILFVSRMSFVVATSIFSFVFIAKRLKAPLEAPRWVLTVAALFSLFC